MNKQSAINLVKSTFENPYDRDRFLNFSRNLFHSFEPATFVYRGNYIPDAYKKQIKTLERIGKLEDRDKNKIDILAVCLNQDSTLERARTLQRNFISWYLNGSRGDVTKDAALVAFYVDGSKDWRLSLVKMEYRLGKSDAGRLKTFTELTPAKRFSFLVGENENTHTAQKQLLPSLLNEEYPPSLSDLEKIFNVEVVTKEFFEKYKQLFLDTKEALDKIVKADPQIQSDFRDKNIDTVDFTKKLLGQIVFLYFLQKKGWFGVSRDDNWGTGPKEFLRLLFEKQVIDYKNYFNDILEPLFYEALAIERPDDFYSRFDCKIPFLNGGLFDPLNNYDWVHTDIHLPNHLFSNNNPTKEGDRGTGILDVFDRYNFTVKEDEPLEREVAVDPEMLGKVFENLLEVKDRKSKGTYYTPREIVHYMCQESLVNYLATELEGKAIKEDIETLVQIGEAAVEHDTRVTEMGEETETYSYKLPASIRQNAQAIDESLANIRVCDPAVGSGAFLVGMMTEIIRVRNTISSYFVDGDRSIYTFKHHAIQNSLYGVDIDPGATEIAKLRLWLSLIVDEQDIKKIKPLPNLDYKIMRGNSLLEEFEGIKLFDEELFTKPAFDNTAQIEDLKVKISELQREFMQLYENNQLQSPRAKQIGAELQKYNKTLKKLTETPKPKTELTGLFDQESEAKAKAKELKRLQKEFFLASHKKEKDQIKKRIESLTWELIEATLREQGKESLMREVEKYKKANIRPFFLWKLNFSEVFENKGGFDVVLANPPYVNVFELSKDKKFDKDAYQKKYKSATGAFDLYILFHELCVDLAKRNGVVTLISPNKFLSAEYADNLRRYIVDNVIFINIVDLSSIKVFDASVYPIVSIYKKSVTNVPIEVSRGVGEIGSIEIVSRGVFTQDHLRQSPNLIWSFLISGSLSIYQKINIHRKITDVCDVTASFSVSEAYEMKKIVKEIDSISTRLNYRKLLISSSIQRYFSTWGIKPITYLKSKFNKPAVILDPNVLSQHRIDQILGEKIIIAGMTKEIRAFRDGSGEFVASIPTVILTNFKVDSRFLLGLINSKLYSYYFHQLYGSLSLSGGYLRIGVPQISSLPYIETGKQKKRSIIELVRKIESLSGYEDVQTKQEYRDLGKKIDQLVYSLYDLSPEEVAIVEGGQNG